MTTISPLAGKLAPASLLVNVPKLVTAYDAERPDSSVPAEPIIAKYGIAATVVNTAVDPTCRFMTMDWDGRIRTDCSSSYAMVPLVAMRDRFDIAFANDADHDRHGIITPTAGLMNPNHCLTAAISYVFTHRPEWSARSAVGKTIVSSGVIDRVTKGLGRHLIELARLFAKAPTPAEATP